MRPPLRKATARVSMRWLGRKKEQELALSAAIETGCCRPGPHAKISRQSALQVFMAGYELQVARRGKWHSNPSSTDQASQA